MEKHVIVSVGEAHPSHLQRGQVKHGDDFCVAILHGSPQGTEYMLECRAAHLMDYIFESLCSKLESIEAALNDAFDKMDVKLQQENKKEAEAASGPFRHDLLWRTRNNSCVAVVCGGIVYCMGYAEGRVVLCRRGKDYNLHFKELPMISMRIFLFSNPYSEEHRFHYFRKESLCEDDEFLFLATEIVWQYLDENSGGLSPAFFTRVNAFGLVEAAKQIIGHEMDDSKVLIAIPLVSSVRDWKVTRVEVPPDEDYGQAPLIVPLIGGEPQRPEARTSLSWTGYHYEPIVESGPSGLSEWICKPPPNPISYLRGDCARCTIVMQLGNLLEWSINGVEDATTLPDQNSGLIWITRELLAIRAPGGVEAIHVSGMRTGMKLQDLRSCYEDSLLIANKFGLKYVAFPEFTGWTDRLEDAASVALDSLVISERGVPEVHFFFEDPKALETWADLFLSSSYDPRSIKHRMGCLET